MTEPSVAEEYLARRIAFAHGQTPLYRSPDGLLVTVALSHKMPDERTGWSWETERYVTQHWREYLEAAREMIRFRSEQ